MRVLRRLVGRLPGREQLPAGFTGVLAPQERVLAVGAQPDGSHIVVTTLGAWVPEAGGHRRIGWQWVSKASWDRGTLVLIEGVAEGTADDVVLIADRPPLRYPLAEPGRVPEVVQARVTGSIRTSQHRALAGGGAWFVQRKLPGEDGIMLQVRPDPGTDPDAVRRVAAEVAERLRRVREQP